MKKQEPIFTWNPETGVTTCTVKYKNKTFYGEAHCHPDDRDMMGRTTGWEISLRRARIEAYKSLLEETRIKYSALNHYYHTMAISPKFNKESYENKMLQRQLNIINSDLTAIKEQLAMEKENLKVYINEKDKFYKSVRINRQKKV